MAQKAGVNEQEFQQISAALHRGVEEAAKAVGLTPEELDALREGLQAGVPLYQIRGIEEKVMEARYAVAYQLYAAGNYKAAEKVFRWLCSYDHESFRFWMGEGACLQALEEYEEAIAAYQMASLFEGMQDPTPFYYCALCLLQAKRKEDACVALEATLTLANEQNAAHKEIIDKAQALLQTLAPKSKA
ncbi:MAG: SycD/LcrH family type III secretion system chaperone [Desulfovibrionaceae bacterium]|nr:SycD/LcrH family type III secretion system chaperone [Desulfovibrionaceae bacterium]